MFLIDVDELRWQKDSYNYDFERRMAVFEGGVGTKPRRTKHPQQQYACSCTTMCTYQGDILSSTCRDCKVNCAAIPDCRMCKCNCQTGIFTEKDVQAMAIKKAQKDEIKARQLAPETERRALINFGALLSSSVKNGIKNLRRSNSSINETNPLSAAAGNLSRLQMPSKEELHSIQQIAPLTTKLCASGGDVRQVLNANPRKKGKRHSQNGLR
jgi:hypothetical protein